jgi:hypothetical protein
MSTACAYHAQPDFMVLWVIVTRVQGTLSRTQWERPQALFVSHVKTDINLNRALLLALYNLYAIRDFQAMKSKTTQAIVYHVRRESVQVAQAAYFV